MAYARDIMLFCRFLHQSRGGKLIWDCNGEDLRVYKRVRLLDSVGAVSAGTWNRGIAALDKWAQWAIYEGLLERAPFRYLDKAVMTADGVRKMKVNAEHTSDPQDEPVRFVPFEDYRLWRDVGLRGELSEGGPDRRWRGGMGSETASLLIFWCTRGCGWARRRVSARQFRRTLAWHLAHQSFGIVAGSRQYQHAELAMFEGYAGTFVSAEFARIRRELGDLPGVVASPSRLRAMLAHLTKTLHPGVLNDCFYQATQAACASRAKPAGRPLPLLNTCLHCPNARRSTAHLPALITARNQIQAPLTTRQDLPRLQILALTEYETVLHRLITELTPDHESTDHE